MKIVILVLFLILEDRGRILIKDKLKLHMGALASLPVLPLLQGSKWLKECSAKVGTVLALKKYIVNVKIK